MSCRKAEYKDLSKYKNTRKQQKRRYRMRTGSCLYQPKAWTESEDELVVRHDIKDTELSVLLKRSVQSIQIRRCRLKKLEVAE